MDMFLQETPLRFYRLNINKGRAGMMEQQDTTKTPMQSIGVLVQPIVQQALILGMVIFLLLKQEER